MSDAARAEAGSPPDLSAVDSGPSPDVAPADSGHNDRGAPPDSGPRPARPNIVLITTDDHALQVGTYGDSLASTPNIDSLAASGVRFANGYVTQASCSASRSSMFTGSYPHQNRQLGLSHKGFSMRSDFPTIPSILHAAGYRTGVVGKVHVAPFSAFTWDLETRHDGWKDESGKQVSTRDVRRAATTAREFISASVAANKPFFLKVSFLDPHDPWADNNVVMGLPEAPMLPANITPSTLNAWTRQPFGAISNSLRGSIVAYYNCVERADHGVGLLLRALADAGQASNTLILLVGDNGGGPIQGGKTDIYENGLRVPFIAKYPGHQTAGQVRNELVSTVDLLPTILAAAGVAVPAETSSMMTEGRSLLPLVRGDASPAWRRYLFAEMNYHGPDVFKPSRSVRDERYKLIRSYPPLTRGVGGYELFDLQEDRLERTNLAGRASHAEVQARLANELRAWQVRTGENANAPVLPGP